MSEWWTFRAHPGIRAANAPPDYLLSEDTVARPQCEQHDADLEPVTVDGLDLKEESTLAACPRCFSGTDGVDTDKLREAIASDWEDYQSHFTQSDPPSDDADFGHFEVYEP
jgi:hypothetical protein